MKNRWLNLVLIWILFSTTASAEKIHKEAPENRRVGIAYSQWCNIKWWQDVWDLPADGIYDSRDRSVIRRHAAQLADAGVDFVWLDWSNNVQYDRDSLWLNRGLQDQIEDATDILFDEYRKLEQRGFPHPKISIFLGTTGAPESASDGRLQRKADQIWNDYYSNPKYRDMIEFYEGKPLLVVYVDTPSPWNNGLPPWNDDRFTVRFMTGYISEQSWLRTKDRVSKFGYWSWEDRGEQTYPIHNGIPESMVITAAQRQQNEEGQPGYIPARGRRNGQTLIDQFARARKIGVHYAMVVSWNEWTTSEQPDVEHSKDLEPSEKLGDFYLRLLKEQITVFKSDSNKAR